MEYKLNIKLKINQYKAIKDKNEEKSACGICAIALIMNHLNKNEVLTVDELLNQGRKIEKQNPIGWTHKTLIHLLHNNGYSAYSEEFISSPNGEASIYSQLFIDKMLETFIDRIKNNSPVLISVKHCNGRKGTHILVLSGVSIINNKVQYWLVEDSEMDNSRKIDSIEFNSIIRPFVIFVDEYLGSETN